VRVADAPVPAEASLMVVVATGLACMRITTLYEAPPARILALL
jgi:hypothetical protein